MPKKVILMFRIDLKMWLKFVCFDSSVGAAPEEKSSQQISKNLKGLKKNRNKLLWQLFSEKWNYKVLFRIKFWTTFYYFDFFAVIRRVIINTRPSVIQKLDKLIKFALKMKCKGCFTLLLKLRNVCTVYSVPPIGIRNSLIEIINYKSLFRINQKNLKCLL